MGNVIKIFTSYFEDHLQILQISNIELYKCCVRIYFTSVR